MREERPEEERSRLSNLLGMFWALPLTISGFLLAFPVLAWRGHVYIVRNTTQALLICGPLGDFLLAHHPFGRMTAMAIGHVVLCEQKGLSRRILTHELEHVRQAMRWGILFPFAYIASSVWAKLRGRDAYWHNAFEIAARDAEKHA